MKNARKSKAVKSGQEVNYTFRTAVSGKQDWRESMVAPSMLSTLSLDLFPDTSFNLDLGIASNEANRATMALLAASSTGGAMILSFRAPP